MVRTRRYRAFFKLNLLRRLTASFLPRCHLSLEDIKLYRSNVSKANLGFYDISLYSHCESSFCVETDLQKINVNEKAVRRV